MAADPGDPANPGGADADADGIPDVLDTFTGRDADADGYSDFWELVSGTDPLDPASFPPLGDADGSGGKAGFVDAVVIFNIFLGNMDPETPGFAGTAQMDLNRDGTADSTDAVILLNWFLGNIPYIPFPQ